jgi:hypothetical protein
MHFSFSFLVHFGFSFFGYLFVGIYLCRGSWRNLVKYPLPIGMSLIFLGHLWNVQNKTYVLGFAALFFLAMWHSRSFKVSDVRDGHNVFSLLVGAALFALTVQLHSLLFGVPVFQLVK